MKQQILVLFLILLLAGCAPSPTPAPPPTPPVFPTRSAELTPKPAVRLGGKVVYLPGVRVANFQWQRTGYGRPYGAIGKDPELHNRGMWSYSWGLGNCMDIPMVYSDNQMPPLWALQRCAQVANVLLAFNEPEWASQANMTPEAAAKTLRYLESVWPGELYCCGNIISHAGWLDRMMAAYQATYGGTPRLAGTHVHIYVGDGLPDVANPTDGKWLARNMADLQRYLQVMRKWQIPPNVIVSECCLLGKHSEGTYLAVQNLYMPWLRSVREIQSVAWFSARYAGFPEANLLQAGGGLTVVGQNWLDWRWK